MAVRWIASLRLAMTWEHRSEVHPPSCGADGGSCTHPRKIFFVDFVDGIFTTFIERPFTNTFDAIGESRAISCV
jgi:hypothetical protein